MQLFRGRRRRGRRLTAALVVGSAIAVVLPSPASAATYPIPPHDFGPLAGAHPAYTPANGVNDRPLLVAVVAFSDQTAPATLADATVRGRMFGPQFPNVRDYFRANSFGRMDFPPAAEACGTTNDGVVRVTLGTRASYDAMTEGAQDRAILDAVNARNCLNFASYDRNGNTQVTDDEVTFLMIDATGANCGALRGIDGPPTYNGVTIHKSMARSASNTNIITIAHEVGHSAFGTRDLYGFAVGSFDLFGPTCGPPDATTFNAGAWQKTHLGWISPTVVGRDGYADVPRADTSPSAFLLYDPDRGTNDYFLVETRRPTAGTYDQNVQDDGLVIWRADNTVYNTGDDNVRPVELMRADGATKVGCVEGQGCYGGSNGDAWNRADAQFPQDTMERTWRDGTASRVAVRAICDAADTMRVYFDVRGPGVLVNTCHRAADTLHPGAATVATFPVMNTGEAAATFAFTVSGLPAGWTASTDTQTLAAGAGGVARVQVTPPLDAPPGSYSYRVVGTDTANPAITSSALTSGQVVLDRTQILYTGSPGRPTGEAAGFQARVINPDLGNSPVVGVPVTFRLSDGVRTLTDTRTTNAAGEVSSNPTLTVPAGSYTLTLSVPRFGRHAAATAEAAYTVLRRPAALAYSGATTADYHDPAALAATLTDAISGAPLANQTVTFTLGNQTTSATTSASGLATASIFIEQPAGPVTLTSAFAGDATYLPATASTPFTITKEQTTLVYTGDTGLIANGRSARLAGVLKEEGVVPIAGRNVTFTLGSGSSAQTCSATTDGAGAAACTLNRVAQPLGPGTATASFAGDAYYLPSSGSGSTVVFQPGGAFAIEASGLLATIPRQPHVQCPPGGSATSATISTAVGQITGFNASCRTDPVTGTTVTTASMASANLLGGALRITDIRSSCTAGPGGISCTSSVGSVNGIPIGSAQVTLDILGVGRVALNEAQSNGPGRPVRNAVRVVTLLERITLAQSYFV